MTKNKMSYGFSIAKYSNKLLYPFHHFSYHLFFYLGDITVNNVQQSVKKMSHIDSHKNVASIC